jgi:hypothetical protein
VKNHSPGGAMLEDLPLRSVLSCLKGNRTKKRLSSAALKSIKLQIRFFLNIFLQSFFLKGKFAHPPRTLRSSRMVNKKKKS